MSARPRFFVAIGAIALAAAADACHARPPPEGASGREAPRAASRATDASACATCHSAIAEEWRASFHRAAFTDPSFQRSLSLEEPKELAFCVRCHAPAEASAGREVGVDCTSCHVRPHEPADASSTQIAKGTAACARCHEFAFDDGRADLVQKTLSEHAASPWSGVPCTECHMPANGGHKDHRFLAGHDPTRQIGRAVHVTLARANGDGPPSVRVGIRVDAGHAFPTGDMFRRARLLVLAEDETGAIVADGERIFGRTWGSEREGTHAGRRKETGDTRIRGAYDETIPLDVGGRTIARVHWSLFYERVLAQRGPHVELASSDVVASGTLVW